MEKPQEEQQRRDTSPWMDRHAIDVAYTEQKYKLTVQNCIHRPDTNYHE